MAVWKRVEELEIGDHVYRPNSVKVMGLRIGGDDVFLYCHHGIVAEVDGEKVVIAFGRKPPSDSTTESYVGRKAREAAIKAMSALVSMKFRAEIKIETAQSFAFEGRVHIYRYGVSDGGCTYVDGSSPAVEVNKGAAAAEIAKLFVADEVETDMPFGEYDLGKWNCECFASFCKTTCVGIEALRAALENLGSGEFLSQEFLRKDSEAKTWQIERFIKKGWARKRQKAARPFSAGEGTHAAAAVSSAEAPAADTGAADGASDDDDDVQVVVEIEDDVDDEA